MHYATELIQLYRQALHQLWNMHFWAPEPFRDYASERQFNRVKLPLFLALVLDRLGSDLPDPQHIFGNAFKVVPPLTRTNGGFLPFLIERPAEKGLWKKTDGGFAAGDLKLSVIDFFDWQQPAWRDFRYFLVNVDECAADPSLVDCRGLVDIHEVDVLWEPPGIVGLPRRFHDPREPDA